MAPERTTQVVVPVKSFARAKARLAPALALPERAELARRMATGVVHAAGPARTWVVCDDEDVAAWAEAEGAAVCRQPGEGLNGAVNAAVLERFAAGATRVVVVHGDLPLVSSLAWLEEVDEPGAVVLAADRHGTGTNVISTPTPAFRFAYGPGSFARHLDEVARLGLVARIAEDVALGWDVDEPADLAALPRRT